MNFTNMAATLQTLLTTEAEQAARATGFVQRVRKLSGATFVQTLVFGWLHNPHAALDELADLAADLGADLTPQALDQRLTPRASRCLADVLNAALQRVVATTPAALPLLRRFNGVYVYDTTIVSLPASLAELFPGCGGRTVHDGQAALKAHACLELTTGALDLDFGPGRLPDVSSALARGPLPEGALRLADRGFFDMDAFQDDTDAGVYWISRVRANLIVHDASDWVGALPAFLRRQKGDQIDVEVRVGGGGRLRCRLLARRVPAAVVAQRRARLLQQAKKKGKKVSAAQLTLCAWNVLITNLPVAWLRWEEAWVLYRTRWQIELLFKLWKSHGGLEDSRGERAARVLCELYAKFIGQVVQHWLLVTCGGPCLMFSYPKAARRIRRQAVVLALLLSVPAEMVRVLERIHSRIQKRCRVQKRGDRPSTYQRLLDPDRSGFQDEQPQKQETELWAA
jgi:Transposase DDE domain